MPQTKTRKRKHRKISFRGFRDFRVFDLAPYKGPEECKVESVALTCTLVTFIKPSQGSNVKFKSEGKIFDRLLRLRLMQTGCKTSAPSAMDFGKVGIAFSLHQDIALR